ncbi:MAG: ABC transporter ATP-binding protein [Planctomycetota bacterium]
MPEFAIETHALTRTFDAKATGSEPVRALRGLTLQIPRGEIFGLIGPNGAGKTTLMRILATLEEPDHGWARVAGHDCSEQRIEVCRRVGFMPELFSLYEDLKVWEYLEFFAGAYEVPPAEIAKTVDAVIELTDLGVRRDSFAGTLSKGMRQRLLLAKTLIHDPEVLILDEPTSGMDPQARIEFRNLIRTLGKMGKTIIISSHILSDLSEYCTSVAILEQGDVRAHGTIAELQTKLQVRAQFDLTYIATGTDAKVVLGRRDGVRGLRRRDDGVSFELDDASPEARAALLADLIAAGVRVTAFQERGNDLEDIFLQVGATRVQ